MTEKPVPRPARGPGDDQTPPLSRVERWERRTEMPMILLALAFVAAYAWPVIDTSLPPTIEEFLRNVTWTVWVAFAVDFGIRIALAERRLRYIAQHWYDVLMIAVPAFRPLRILRVLSAARLLNRMMTRRLVGRASIYVAATSVMCVVFGAIAVLDVEQRHQEANITEFGDALWWAIVTSATVGYGDFYPVTTTGRFIAVGLMLIGIAMLGAVTAGVASWAISAVAREEAQSAERPR
ncbi:potassium channel family protein [Zhihengliuella halotolerans]|uniref:potassium channel family protein n=1 Tax=Zhihengliuella halotolerans TaxID=370736 RepID=UPI000C80A06B|nr:potassium channel family protein [Zhihengliuella halotolerans]